MVLPDNIPSLNMTSLPKGKPWSLAGSVIRVPSMFKLVLTFLLNAKLISILSVLLA